MFEHAVIDNDLSKRVCGSILAAQDDVNTLMSVDYMGGRDFWISLIRVYEEAQGKGWASKALDYLCQVADAEGVRFGLKAIAMRPEWMSQEVLESFYQRKGFAILRENDDGSVTMWREPEPSIIHQKAA